LQGVHWWGRKGNTGCCRWGAACRRHRLQRPHHGGTRCGGQTHLHCSRTRGASSAHRLWRCHRTGKVHNAAAWSTPLAGGDASAAAAASAPGSAPAALPPPGVAPVGSSSMVMTSPGVPAPRCPPRSPVLGCGKLGFRVTYPGILVGTEVKTWRKISI
jgi:hypothetical protein